MPYIGKPPGDKVSGLGEKNVFTGDGSTVAFDLGSEATSENDIDVFIDNVRQEPGTGKAYTLGNDGSGDLKRITFSAAPDNSAEIYVINRMQENIISTVSDNSITGAKIALGSDAQGDVMYYNGSDWARLGVGTSGQYLKTQGSAANPVWGTVVTDPSMGGDLSGTASNASIVANAVDTTTIADNAVTGAKIALGSDAQGDIMYYNGTDYVRHAPGTSGQFLKTQGAAANPTWADVPAGAPTGGGTEKVFYENENSVDTNYTLTTNFNAVSAGPVTVASGVTVTIPAGQAWVIV